MSLRDARRQEPTHRRLFSFGLIMTLATVAVGFLCSLLGPFPVLETSDFSPWTNPIWLRRVSRIAAAASAGFGLSIAGVMLQALLRNPLAEPYILGVSSGAAVGVITGLAFAAQFALPVFALTPALAFAGALASAIAVYAVAQRRGLLDPYTLILSGVMISAINGAIVLLIYLIIDPNTLTAFIGWSMGHVPDAVSNGLLLICAGGVFVGFLFAATRGAAYNVLALGDDVARSSGVRVDSLRIWTFAVASLMTAGAVALVGPIGFVGLLVPHVCRVILGPDNRQLVIVSGFAGAVFLMASDTLCRQIAIWANLGRIPVGILTALLGGPFFLWLLKNHIGRRAV